MQVVFFGYGTGWHWGYYYSIAVHILACFTGLYSLRFRLAVLNGFAVVKVWSVVVILGVYVETLLPIAGILTVNMLHLVPFRSPTWTLVYYYIMVGLSP
jgi:hypothetical protein